MVYCFSWHLRSTIQIRKPWLLVDGYTCGWVDADGECQIFILVKLLIKYMASWAYNYFYCFNCAYRRILSLIRGWSKRLVYIVESNWYEPEIGNVPLFADHTSFKKVKRIWWQERKDVWRHKAHIWSAYWGCNETFGEWRIQLSLTYANNLFSKVLLIVMCCLCTKWNFYCRKVVAAHPVLWCL